MRLQIALRNKKNRELDTMTPPPIAPKDEPLLKEFISSFEKRYTSGTLSLLSPQQYDEMFKSDAADAKEMHRKIAEKRRGLLL
jgi:hypothetical protein